MTFEGFPDEGLVFYEGLEADNSKTYWTRHKPIYEACVRGPLTALLDEVAPEFGTAKLFRPYRDPLGRRTDGPARDGCGGGGHHHRAPRTGR